MKNLDGFTLVEMMVVLLIIGIISPVFFFAHFQSERDRANNEVTISQIRTLINRSESYALDKGAWPATPGCSGLNASLVAAGYLKNSLPNNGFGKPYSFSCTGDALTITTTVKPTEVFLYTAGLPNTTVINPGTGEISSTVYRPNSNYFIPKLFRKDGSVKMTGSWDNGGFDMKSVATINGGRFIDADDPNFFVVPSSNSNISELDISGSIIDGGTFSSTNTISASAFVDAEDLNFYFNPAGTSILNDATMGSLTTEKFSDTNDPSYYFSPSVYSILNDVNTESTTTAPIFYDKDDSSYYMQFSGTSNFKNVYSAQVVATQLRSMSNPLYVLDPSALSNLFSVTTTFPTIAQRLVNGGYYFDAENKSLVASMSADSTVTTRVFYDIDNPAYFINPIVTSQLNTINAVGSISASQFVDMNGGVVQPSGGSYINGLVANSVLITSPQSPGGSCFGAQISVDGIGRLMGCQSGSWTLQ